MNSIQFFEGFSSYVKASRQWQAMEYTVEGSEWHREANTAVHTQMCIDGYLKNAAALRSERHQLLTLITLLFHDFGKPEAEETIERKDGSGSFHRYAGHEPVSANEFVSFMCANRKLTESFFAQGYNWEDIRKIKFMIENHLPFGMKNPNKRDALRQAVAGTLGEDEQCFYDQLWYDCCGRISDDHDAKKEAVYTWIEEFDALPVRHVQNKGQEHKCMYVLTGAPGSGKSTWTAEMNALRVSAGGEAKRFEIVCEDTYRLEFAKNHIDFKTEANEAQFMDLNEKDQYAEAWKFCVDNEAQYTKYAAQKLDEAVKSGKDIVLDRTNLSRKGRAKWIQAAKDKGYRIRGVEFYNSEQVLMDRQDTRGDKAVPKGRVHQMYMSNMCCWFPIEVDFVAVKAPW